MHMIAQAVLPGELVFDVGANRGDKAAWFADRGARVVAVEPQAPLVVILRERFADNPNVTVVPKGVSDRPGVLQMSISTDDVLSTFSEEWKTGRFKDKNWSHQVAVDVTTLDQLIAEHGIPRYAKIDVEGYEKQVIDGLSQKIGSLSFEYTAEFLNRSEYVIKRLETLGFQYFNAGFGELPDFVFRDRWVGADFLVKTLKNHGKNIDPMNWGDIYAA